MSGMRFDQVQDLIARAEWIEASLNGTTQSPGLISKLDRLLSQAKQFETGQETALGVARQEAAENAALAFRAQLDEQIGAALNDLRNTLPNVFRQYESAFHGLNDQAGEIEAAQRLGREQLKRFVEESRSTFGNLSQQSAQVVDEIQRMLSAERLSPQISEVMKSIAITSLAEVNANDLKGAMVQELQKAKSEITHEVTQTLEGIVELISEGRQESAELVTKLLRNRGPSDTIIALNDELHRMRAELQAKEHQLDELRKTGEGVAALPSSETLSLSRGSMIFIGCASALAAIPGSIALLWTLAGNGLLPAL